MVLSGIISSSYYLPHSQCLSKEVSVSCAHDIEGEEALSAAGAALSGRSLNMDTWEWQTW